MAKPEWGAKRICYGCGARYYDLRRDPPVCPKCGTQFDPEAFLKSRRGRTTADAAPAARAKAVEAPEAEVDLAADEAEVDAESDVTDADSGDTEDFVDDVDDEVNSVIEDADDLDDTDLDDVAPGNDDDDDR